MKTRLNFAAFSIVFLVAPNLMAQTVEIWQIQGDGMSSPYEDQRVTTTGNVVTAVGTDLFFIQCTPDRADGDPWTSDGIVVHLGTTPSVSVGDVVDVSGTVRENFGQTEIAGGPTVTVTSSGHQRPPAAVLDSNTPTPLQPWPESELERFEGMWVEVRSGIVSAASDGFGEACVSAGGDRLFREPGILWPGLSGLAVWDGNPEGFEFDPYALGNYGFDLTAGTTFRADGVLAFAYGAYQLWSVSYETIDEPVLPRPAAAAARGEATMATQNLYRLGDPGDNVSFEIRLAKLSRQVREVLGAPDVVVVQEATDLETLVDLADQIAGDDPSIQYAAYLEEGQDYSDIDVGFLVRRSIEVGGIEQIGADVRFSWDDSYLFDRPPLALEAVLPVVGEGLEVTLVAVHLRSLNGIDDPEDGERVRQKRFEQSGWLSEWIQNRQTADPERLLFVLGDLNAYEFSDGYVDVVGQVTGSPDPDGSLLPATEEVDPELVDWVDRLPRSERFSFVFGCSAEALDHILTNSVATPWVRGVEFARGNADAPRDLEFDPDTALRSSDHDGLVLYLGPRHRRSTGRRLAN